MYLHIFVCVCVCLLCGEKYAQTCHASTGAINDHPGSLTGPLFLRASPEKSGLDAWQIRHQGGVQAPGSAGRKVTLWHFFGRHLVVHVVQLSSGHTIFLFCQDTPLTKLSILVSFWGEIEENMGWPAPWPGKQIVRSLSQGRPADWFPVGCTQPLDI